MANQKETKANAKNSGYKTTSSATKDCYSNSVADNVKTQKQQTSDNRERRDGPGGN